MAFEKAWASIAALVPERFPQTPPVTGDIVDMWSTPYVVEMADDPEDFFAAMSLVVNKWPWEPHEGAPAIRVIPVGGDRPLFFFPAAIRRGDGPSVIELSSARDTEKDWVIRPITDDDGPTLIGREATADEISQALQAIGF